MSLAVIVIVVLGWLVDFKNERRPVYIKETTGI